MPSTERLSVKPIFSIDTDLFKYLTGLMRTISITKLKAQISARIKEVRAGKTYLITDRSQTVAKLSPLDDQPNLVVRPPLRTKPNYENRLKIKIKVDPAQFLIDDRRRNPL